jgi:hypothetical protein
MIRSDPELLVLLKELVLERELSWAKDLNDEK